MKGKSHASLPARPRAAAQPFVWWRDQHLEWDKRVTLPYCLLDEDPMPAVEAQERERVAAERAAEPETVWEWRKRVHGI